MQGSVGTEVAALIAERDALRLALQGAWIRHRPAENCAAVPGRTGEPATVDDMDLIQRIRGAFRLADATPVGPPESMWLVPIAEMREGARETLLSGSDGDVAAMIRDPRETRLLYGFEYDDLYSIHAHAPPWHERVYDSLLRLAEAVGTVRLEYPEAPPHLRTALRSEDILAGLDEVFGFRILFPNVFPAETGLATERGVATFRSIWSLYQAWRCASLVKANTSARILEIGGGLGRAAYYMRQFGCQDYTIIDLPMTGVAQGYFLGRTVGTAPLRLYGEDRPGTTRVLPPASFMESDERYDLIVNVDSLTEMAYSTASDYFRKSSELTSTFLSINHEYNPFTVKYIIDMNSDGLASTAIRSRAPCWLRRGYVEEVVRFQTALPSSDPHDA